ncbi:hypothetical protein [uncultured Clostridium sp.]|nr:hypothetical protein [uncultured Clostridium sp.]
MKKKLAKPYRLVKRIHKGGVKMQKISEKIADWIGPIAAKFSS